MDASACRLLEEIRGIWLSTGTIRDTQDEHCDKITTVTNTSTCCCSRKVNSISVAVHSSISACVTLTIDGRGETGQGRSTAGH